MESTVDGARVTTMPWLRMTVGDEAVTLMSANRALHYEGQAATLLADVVPLLDGRSNSAGVAEKLGDPGLASAVEQLCQRLVADRFAVPVPPVGHSAPADSVFAVMSSGTRPEAALDLTVAGNEAQHAAIGGAVSSTLRVNTISLADLSTKTSSPESLTVVWVRDLNDPALQAWNQRAWRERRTWLPIVDFDGQVAIVGPLIVAPQTPCLDCLRRRRAASSGLGETYLGLRAAGTEWPTSRPLTGMLAALAVMTLADWASRSNPFAPGAIHTITLDQGPRVDMEYVLKVPRCPTCRPAAARLRSAVWSRYVDDIEADVSERADA